MSNNLHCYIRFIDCISFWYIKKGVILKYKKKKVCLILEFSYLLLNKHFLKSHRDHMISLVNHATNRNRNIFHDNMFLQPESGKRKSMKQVELNHDM